MLNSADLEFFAVVARSPSLAAAARDLDVTPSAVTQRLQDLERRVGVRLVDRRARRLALTDAGEMLATRGRTIADELAALQDVLATHHGEVAGHLRVLAPFGFGRAHVAPIAAQFLEAHPGVTLDLTLADRLERAPESSWDVAVHIGEPRETTLTTHWLAPNARWLCAAPSYLAHSAPVTTPQDLRAHRCIALRENDEDVTLWRFTADDGASTAVRIDPHLASNDGDVVRAWALAGRGIILRSEWSVADDLRTGRLVRVLPAYTAPSVDVVAYVSARRSESARTERFLRALQRSLARPPWRDEPTTASSDPVLPSSGAVDRRSP